MISLMEELLKGGIAEFVEMDGEARAWNKFLKCQAMCGIRAARSRRPPHRSSTVHQLFTSMSESDLA